MLLHPRPSLGHGRAESQRRGSDRSELLDDADGDALQWNSEMDKFNTLSVVKIDGWRWDALLGEAKLDLLRSLAGDDGDLLGTAGDLGGVEVGLATVHDVPLVVGEEGSGLLSSLTDE